MSMTFFEDSHLNGLSFGDFEETQSMANEENNPLQPNLNENKCCIIEILKTQEKSLVDTSFAEEIQLSTKIQKQRQKKKPMHWKKPISKKPIKKSITGQYKKNICGYVTKKIIRQFISTGYQSQVEKICRKYGVNYEVAQKLYHGKIERVTGPSHLPDLFSWKTQQKGISMAFLQFFKWFLKVRYVRHLFEEGKMEQKHTYISYKNRELIPMISQIEKSLLLEEHQLLSSSTIGSL